MIYSNSKYVTMTITITCECGHTQTVQGYSDILRVEYEGGCSTYERAFVIARCPSCKGYMEVT